MRVENTLIDRGEPEDRSPIVKLLLCQNLCYPSAHSVQTPETIIRCRSDSQIAVEKRTCAKVCLVPFIPDKINSIEEKALKFGFATLCHSLSRSRELTCGHPAARCAPTRPELLSLHLCVPPRQMAALAAAALTRNRYESRSPGNRKIHARRHEARSEIFPAISDAAKSCNSRNGWLSGVNTTSRLGRQARATGQRPVC